MKACILAIGDEIVGGITADTNSGFLAQTLRAAGIEPVGMFAVADDEAAILQALRRAVEDADVILTTGGLGPTTDDLTTACVAHFAGVPLALHEPSLRNIEERFRTMGIPMSPNNRKQALLPDGSEPIRNTGGTAPGFSLEVPVARGSVRIACMPGVPREMRRMVEESVLPWLVRLGGALHIGNRVFSTVGLTESALDEMLAGVVSDDEGRLSFRAAFPRLQARVTVTGSRESDVEAKLTTIEARVRARLGSHVYAVGDEGLEETVGRLLLERGETLSLAESCTGGLIGHRITDVPGSSAYFLLGVVAYSNAMKESLLGVRGDTIERHGAVSRETVLEMAEGVRRRGNTSYGVATSGIAGPGGGSEGKPIGTVWVALSWEGGAWAHEFHLGQRTRTWIKEMTAQIALERLRRRLLGIPLEG